MMINKFSRNIGVLLFMVTINACTSVDDQSTRIVFEKEILSSRAYVLASPDFLTYFMKGSQNWHVSIIGDVTTFQLGKNNIDLAFMTKGDLIYVINSDSLKDSVVIDGQKIRELTKKEIKEFESGMDFMP